MEYKIEELDQHTWLIEEYDETTSVYCYLLEGDERAVLIDTGMGTIPLDKICAGLTEKPIKVLLTHGHVDHIGGTSLFPEVFLNRADLSTYRLHSGELRKEFCQGKLLPVKAGVDFLSDGDLFLLGNRTVEVIETPGHSVGSVCFLDREHRWLFTGDTCCKAHVLLQMEYSTPVSVYLESIRHLLLRRNEFDVTWPGHHGRPVDAEILEQYKEAAEMLVEGSAEGVDFEVAGHPAKLLEFKDIGIEYP